MARLLCQIERYEVGRTAQARGALDGDSGALFGIPSDRRKRMPDKQPVKHAGHGPDGIDGIEKLRLDRFGEVNNRNAVAEPGRIRSIGNVAVYSMDFDLIYGIIQLQRYHAILCITIV